MKRNTVRGPGFDSKQTPFGGIADRTCVTLGSRYNPAGKRGQEPIHWNFA